MKDIIDSLTYVLKKESNIDIDSLRKLESYINYPQWLATLNMFGWENSIGLGHSDRAALFPLNVTLLRLNGVMTNRKKFFSGNLALAATVRKRLDLPSSIDLQIATFITSNIHVRWNELNDDAKLARYKWLWVNFKGSLWKDLQALKESGKSLTSQKA